MNKLNDATQGLDVYIVGGAVRDSLMGRAPGDRDWVVVGATPEAMEQRGFIPVGGDFPVFLHPRTKEEYALARTERKSGRGYRGFTFYTGRDVTLEDDLRRRDLTINAMAMADDGRLIDPLGGQADIEARILRHVGTAFSEDPVRLLRLARFAARFPEFSIAPETLELARQLVTDGEVDTLVPERVWQEIAQGLMSIEPVRMLQVLEQTGALARVLPGLVIAEQSAGELKCAARAQLPLHSRYALMCRHTSAASVQALSGRLKAPRACYEAARLLPSVVHTVGAPTMPESTLELLLDTDAVRRPQRFMDLLCAAHCVAPFDVAGWEARLNAVQTVDGGRIAQDYAGRPKCIRRAINEARLEALKTMCT